MAYSLVKRTILECDGPRAVIKYNLLVEKWIQMTLSQVSNIVIDNKGKEIGVEGDLNEFIESLDKNDLKDWILGILWLRICFLYQREIFVSCELEGTEGEYLQLANNLKKWSDIMDHTTLGALAYVAGRKIPKVYDICVSVINQHFKQYCDFAGLPDISNLA